MKQFSSGKEFLKKLKKRKPQLCCYIHPHKVHYMNLKNICEWHFACEWDEFFGAE